MVECSFKLNGENMSSLKRGSLSFPAFSGMDRHRNQRRSARIPHLGPIPPGTYYVLDRQSGGMLGQLKELFNDKRDRFALYAIDGKIDDEVFCNRVRRGQFRLHPKGNLGISEGCITLERSIDFYRVRRILKGQRTTVIPGTQLQMYGRVTVR
ncbi:DUF2778 domain-containing protein [Burkholderia sp. FERM BP-3421]|jgi:Tlde1 domain|uniref:DUF2778 domain-containing protein n=1 Tax=Burkholderia sp. FERM BP-3421 TaxID=1494466 RepID=UPI002360CB4B|nr:DUF2778 domain-containing protein [Burkholderia sp. FERM BP-3421]WDD95139.1 DUF2778 domain-containing protein [Burkholderia sp. FERM BP-3421]